MTTSHEWHKGSIAHRTLDDGRMLAVWPQIYTYRLTLSEAGDFYGWGRAYCYENPALALAAMQLWDGDGDPPDGWVREIGGEGRRRPDGDPEQEYVRR